VTQKGKLCLKNRLQGPKGNKRVGCNECLEMVEKRSFNGFQRQVTLLRQDPKLFFFGYQLRKRDHHSSLNITKKRCIFLEMWNENEGKTGISSNIVKRPHGDAIKHILVFEN